MILHASGTHMTARHEPIRGPVEFAILGSLDGRPALHSTADGHPEVRFAVVSRPQWPPLFVWEEDRTILEVLWPAAPKRRLRHGSAPQPFRYRFIWQAPCAHAQATLWQPGAALYVEGHPLESGDLMAVVRVRWLSLPN